MNPKSNVDSLVRISVCVKDPQKAAALCEKIGTTKDFVLMKPLWDRPSVIWGADAIILDGEDIAVFQKALRPFDTLRTQEGPFGQSQAHCPAILVETSSDKSAEEIAAALGRAPFGTFSAAGRTEHLKDLIWQAAAHSRLSYSAWYHAGKAGQSASAGLTLAPEPALTLESMLAWLKGRQATDELCHALGDMFERWSGSSRVLMLMLSGQPVSDQLGVVYRSKGFEAEAAKWTWPACDPLVVELEKQASLVTEGPQAYRWMKALSVQYMIPLRAGDTFLGVLAFAQRPGEIPFTPKDLQALGAGASKMSQLIHLYRQSRAVSVPEKTVVTSAASKETLLSSSKDLVRKQQLEIIGRMAMRSSHELKNCLVSIRTFTQLFPEKYADEQFRKDFYQVVSKEVERLNGLVEKLLFFAGPVQLKFTQEKITDLISEALTLFGSEDLRNIQLHKVFGHKQPTLWLDRQHMLAVFFQILQNSLHAMSNGGKLVVVTEDHPHPDFQDGVLVIRFLDTGRGVVLKDPEEPFEPFFSTKARGMGLGLTIAKRIVEEHGGTIRLDSSKDKGTEVILCLPRSIPRWDAQATAQSAGGVIHDSAN